MSIAKELCSRLVDVGLANSLGQHPLRSHDKHAPSQSRYREGMSSALSRRALVSLLAAGAAPTVFALPSASAPAFDVRTETGKRIQLEDYKGKVLLLTFWATWCSHCRRQIAAMEKLRADYAAKDVEMLALSVDKEGWQKVSPYLQEHKLILPVALASPRTQQEYAVAGGIPLSYIIDRQGQMVKDFRGALDEEILRRLGEAIAKSL